MELREQVGVALLVQLAPVDELPRPWEAEERGNIEVYQCQFAVVKHGILRGRRHVERIQVLDAGLSHHATKRLTLIDFDVAQLYGFPRTDQLVNRQYRPQNYGELLTDMYMEVCGPPKEYYSPR